MPSTMLESGGIDQMVDALNKPAQGPQDQEDRESSFSQPTDSVPRLGSEDEEKDLDIQGTEAIGAPAVSLEDWDGPDDPGNPHNWSSWKRWYHTIVSGLIALSATLGSSIYTPGTREVQSQFSVSLTAATLPLSLYVIALGFGPVLAAPLSETYGRRIVYWVSAPISMLFTLGAGCSNTFAALLVCRTLAGAFSAPVLAVGSGTNTDLWPAKNRAMAAWIFLTAPFLGPALGPLIGGYVVMTKSWRWTQWILLMISLAFFGLTLFMDETYKKTILAVRARKRGMKPPTTQIKSRSEMIKLLLTVTLTRPLYMLATEPVVIFSALYISFNFGVLFSFFSAFPIVFSEGYGFDSGSTGLAFLGVAAGVLFAGAAGILLDRVLYRKKHHEAMQTGKRNADPEHRLYGAMIGSFGIPIGLFWFAWSADRQRNPWISPILASVPFAFGNTLIFGSGVLYLIDVYGPMSGASAVAANALGRYGFGAAFPLFIPQMYTKLGTGWATSVFGFISLAMLPIPWLFFKFGPGIRSKSRFAMAEG